VLVPTQDRRRTAPRKLSPRQGLEAQRIEAVLSTPEGQALYRRQQIVEPVFAHTKCIRRTDRFPPPRPRRLPGGMAADRSHPQPAQTLACRTCSGSNGDPEAAGQLTGQAPNAAALPSDPPAQPSLPHRNRKPPLGGFVQQPLFAGPLQSPLTDSNRRPPPYHFRSGARVHARSRETQFFLQIATFRGAGMRRETSRVSFLMCPFCVRGVLSVLTTGEIWRGVRPITTVNSCESRY
jgi:hypothetical protein